MPVDYYVYTICKIGTLGKIAGRGNDPEPFRSQCKSTAINNSSPAGPPPSTIRIRWQLCANNAGGGCTQLTRWRGHHNELEKRTCRPARGRFAKLAHYGR